MAGTSLKTRSGNNEEKTISHITSGYLAVALVLEPVMGACLKISTTLATTLVQVLREVLICCCHSPLLEERRALPINKSNRTTIKIHHCHANVSNELAQCSLLPTQCMPGPLKMNVSTMLNNTSSKLAKATKQLQRQVS